MSPNRRLPENYGYGHWQTRVDPRYTRNVPQGIDWQPGGRVIPTSDHYRADYHCPPYRDPAVEIIRARAAAHRNRERWWHGWGALRRYHKRMFNSLLNEQHYKCVPLMDLRDAERLPQPTWRERHWRGLYIAKWVGGGYLLLQLLRI